MFNLSEIKRIMVFGAHPDDEIIGLGGTIHNLASQKKEINVVTFTDGGTAANSEQEIGLMIKTRKIEMEKTNKILGITNRELLQIPSQQVYATVYGNLKLTNQYKVSNEKEVSLHHTLIFLIRKYRPQILFTHSPDNHRDHCGISDVTPQAVFQASESILKHLGDPWQTPILLHYSIEKELEKNYTPNFIIEISKNNLLAKTKAMATQISQTREEYLKRYDEMLNSRAQLWGSKTFGAGKYAEPFHLNSSINLSL